MRRLSLLLPLVLLCACPRLRVQAQPAAAQSDSAVIVDRPHADEWIRDIDAGWRMHEGDDPVWAAPSFDDAQWEKARLDNLGNARPGWRWFRLHIKLHIDHPEIMLLIQGGEGTYTVYINGVPAPDRQLRSSFGVNRPTERVVPIDEAGTDVVIALRSHIPSGYAAWRLPQFMSVYAGTSDAVEALRQSMLHDRTYFAIPAIVINAFIAFAGLSMFALYGSQRGHMEYFWLGVYFLLVGIGDLLWYLQQSGFIPLAWNVLLADPLIYAFTIAQIRFTFTFGGHRLGPAWRVYQVLLVIPITMIWLVWYGRVPSQAYMLIEPLFILPVAVLLPILLFVWYRRGNREAGWLILPSILPAATTALYDLGSASIYLGWKRLEFLVNYIQVGPIPIEPNDIGNLLFLLGSGIVIFFRFSRVARDQARSAAELAAAREIQQRLVPASLPSLAGFRIEAAYLPAHEVGGDFYQVIEEPNGSLLIVVGDVSGKGLKAAMTGALAIGAIRILAAESLAPAELLGRLNGQILKAQNGGFITCLCARIDRDGKVILANAGHLPPYLGGNEIEVPPGLPMGLVPEVAYTETRLFLTGSQKLTFMSDGVVEASDTDGRLYGFERTREISVQSADAIAAAAVSFGQADDIMVLTLERIAIA